MTSTTGTTLSTRRFLGCVDTPALLARTYTGNPLYTTPDAIDEIEAPFLAQLEIGDLLFRDFKDIPLNKLSKQHKHSRLVLSARPLGKAAAGCDAGGMNVDTHSGRRQVDVQAYLRRIAIDRPRVVVAMADEVGCAGRKRFHKAVERTQLWFHELVSKASKHGVEFTSSADIRTSTTHSAPSGGGEHGTENESTETEAEEEEEEEEGKTAPIVLFGVALYHAQPAQSTQMEVLIQHMLKSGAAGIVVGNLHMGECAAARAEAVRAVQAALPPGVPTMVQGADTLRQVVHALALGVDLIGSNYPESLSSRGIAIALGGNLCSFIAPAPSPVPEQETGTSGVASSLESGGVSVEANVMSQVAEVDVEVTGQETTEGDATTQVVEPGDRKRTANSDSAPISKRQRAEREQGGIPLTSTLLTKHGNCIDLTRSELDLRDSKYARDPKPLVPGCTCHACRNHTRAYIHHLTLSKEMLAEVLLYHHNLHQLQQLFAAARGHISRGTFAAWERQLSHLCE
ncbi:tRNA-guanine(15) transglycosylase-like protein [Ochromonadaceae sp. CCMP2298]|nr:tRNA-guanine(15) transglycosylase-like protein [Ochromonadaceae sp. CCMP2298]